MVAISENPSYTLSPATSSHSHRHVSFDEALYVSPKARVFCEILNNANKPEQIEKLLCSSDIEPFPDVVLEVLRLSFGSPEKAVGFFRWAESGRAQPSPVWDELVDLLGSNGLFEQMWDTIRSMRDKNNCTNINISGNDNIYNDSVLSVNTFVLVFRSYCGAGRVEEAVTAFCSMERFGVVADVAAANALLKEICRVCDGTEKLCDFFYFVKGRITPDIDTYAIVMAGLEKEGNVAKAKVVFGEMVERVGWGNESERVYDAFLVTLFRGSRIDEAIRFIGVLKGEGCFPGLRFFSDAIDILVKKRDLATILLLWDEMVDNGMLPNVGMFNSVIGLFCNNNKIDRAFCFLDEMVLYGAFPDSVTYNTIFKCLVKNKKVREACNFFTEMTKNEFPPTHLNCAAAIALFFDGDDPEMAVEIWYYMVNNRVFPFEESANMLLIGLCNLGRLTELKRFAEKMLERNIHISEATMGKIKQAFQNRGGNACDMYDSLSRKWKSLK